MRPRPTSLHGEFRGWDVPVDVDRVGALIEPAGHHGRGEVDLAMLTLFDRPDPRLDADPTEPPWGGRRPRRPPRP